MERLDHLAAVGVNMLEVMPPAEFAGDFSWGYIVAFAWSSASHQMIGWLQPFAAGGFLYIALADLVPALHHRRGVSAGIVQTVLLLAGILVMALLSRLGHGAP